MQSPPAAPEANPVRDPVPATAAPAATRALLLGIAAAAFFAVTFVLNRSMADAHGHWAWSASLRYYLMLPFLAAMLAVRGEWRALRRALRATPGAWVVWGTVGFVVFYAPLTAAGALAPAWVVAGTWPVTIVAGLLLSPLLYSDHRRRIPYRALLGSLVIVAGVLLLQAEQARAADPATAALGLLLVMIAAVAYPLGNRKMMHVLESSGSGPVDPFVRLAGMTLGSLPAWLLVSGFGYAQAGWPPAGQVMQAGVVALCSGIIATWLFFAATDAVGTQPVALAAVEATQAAEVPFALVLEAMLLGAAWPAPLSWLGLAVIVAGIIGYARLAGR